MYDNDSTEAKREEIKYSNTHIIYVKWHIYSLREDCGEFEIYVTTPKNSHQYNKTKSYKLIN